MKVTYQSRRYTPEAVKRRYVARRMAGYVFCEVGDDRRYDLRQGEVDASELPDDVRTAADARVGHYPPYVDWPGA